MNPIIDPTTRILITVKLVSVHLQLSRQSDEIYPRLATASEMSAILLRLEAVKDWKLFTAELGVINHHLNLLVQSVMEFVDVSTSIARGPKHPLV